MPTVYIRKNGCSAIWVVVVTGIARLDGPTAGKINTRCPRYPYVFIRAQKLPILSVEDIKEPVLRRLHQNFALLPRDLEICNHNLHSWVVIPGVGRRLLVVPLVRAGISVERDNRIGKETVAFLDPPRKRGVSAAIPLIKLGVVDAS